jgi:DEAD/DEAH box helicase domain-containing protein
MGKPLKVVVVGDAHADALGVATDLENGGFEPTLFLYDNYPGGIGLSAPLFDEAERLVGDALGLVAGCPCTAGCPACVGPVLPGDEGRAVTPKAAAARVLGLLGGGSDHGA